MVAIKMIDSTADYAVNSISVLATRSITDVHLLDLGTTPVEKVLFPQTMNKVTWAEHPWFVGFHPYVMHSSAPDADPAGEHFLLIALQHSVIRFPHD